MAPPLDQPHHRNARGRSGFIITTRVIDVIGVATGALIAARWTGPVPAAAVGTAMVTAVTLAAHRHRWRFTLSVLDELPSAVALFGTVTMVTASTLLLTEHVAEARGALHVGVIVLFTALLSRMTAYAVIRRLRHRGIGLARAVMLGSDETGGRLASRLASDPAHGVQLLGFLDDETSLPMCSVPRLGTVDRLKGIVDRYKVDLVLVTLGVHRDDAATDSLRELCLPTCEIYVIPRLFEFRGNCRYEELIDGTPLVRLHRDAFRYPLWPFKRLMDIVIAAFGLAVALPLAAVVALAVCKELGPKVIFKQRRIGMGGEPFTLYKFRSFAAPEDEGDTTWSIDSDPRLGPVGRFIRSTSLDELPQLVNVLQGNMSLVGPRPERPFYVDQFTSTVPGYRYRHRVPVGVTGLAAVNGLRGDTSIADRAFFDNLYADSWSPWLDVKIMLRTLLRLRCR